MPVAFVGPSYQLETRSADVQRSVNMRPVPIESGSGASQFMLQSNPGLRVFAAGAGAGRGLYAVNGRAFAVIGSSLCEVTAGGVVSTIGYVTPGTKPVSLDSNTTQLFVADGARGWVYSLVSGSFVEAFDVRLTVGGSARTSYLDQMAIWAKPGSSTFFISSLGDASAIDALDFASAEALPDNLVSFIVCNRQLYLFGEASTEIWLNTGAADFPLQRYDGTVMGVGCMAVHSAQECNGVPVWLGASKDGIGSVWTADGYKPQRISTRAVEDALAQSSALEDAYAYCWSWRGSSLYCLRAPGVSTTWVYDFLSQSWHEQAELVGGNYTQHRVVSTTVAFGKTLALGDDGVIYEYRADVNNNAGGVLCRDRTSPHDAAGGERKFHPSFEALVDTGVTGEAMLRYSDDGGATWHDWRRKSLGALGHQRARLIWNRCGSARDRVWQLRCTDDVPFSVVDAK